MGVQIERLPYPLNHRTLGQYSPCRTFYQVLCSEICSCLQFHQWLPARYQPPVRWSRYCTRLSLRLKRFQPQHKSTCPCLCSQRLRPLPFGQEQTYCRQSCSGTLSQAWSPGSIAGKQYPPGTLLLKSGSYLCLILLCPYMLFLNDFLFNDYISILIC